MYLHKTNCDVEFFWIILGAFLLIIALVGSVLPVLPGPPLAYVALLLLLIAKADIFSWQFLLAMGIVHLLVVVSDFALPVIGAKRFGASKAGIWGSIIGMLVGMILFPPLGLFLGVLVGAIVGELWSGKKWEESTKAGLASFAFSILAMLFKLIVVFVSIWYFIKASIEIVSMFSI